MLANELTSTTISLFCYPHAPVLKLFEAWQNNRSSVTCLVPEGVAPEALQHFFGYIAQAGASATHQALTVRVIPFLPQADYDKLLWACDVNFVRGEDSFVRAQWSNRPFIWHIYSQDHHLHHVKLKAFLERYFANAPGLAAFTLDWNDANHNPDTDFRTRWPALQADLPHITQLATDWQNHLIKNGDLATNLLKFCKTLAESP